LLKKLESSGFRFFVGGITIGVGLGIFGQGYQALGFNCKSQFHDAGFYWKQDYNLSLCSH